MLLVLGGFIVEAALVLIVFIGPGFAPLVRPGYVIVALIFFLAIWNAATGRSGEERRQIDPDRRNGERRDPATDTTQP
jgi:hypothetical protein